MSKKLSHYMQPPLDDARLARQWAAIASRPPTTSRKKIERFWMIGGLAGGLAVAALVLVFAWPSANDLQTQAVTLNSSSDEITMDLADGSQIALEPHSQLEVEQRTKSEVRLQLVRGKAKFHVTHREKRSFEVLIRGVRVQVVGTKFQVSNNELNGKTEVGVNVEQGTVRVTPPAQPGFLLHAGQTWSMVLTKPSLKISANSALSAPSPSSPSSPMVGTSVPEQPSPGTSSTTTKPAPSSHKTQKGTGDSVPDAVPTLATANAKQLFEMGNQARRSGNLAGAVQAYDTLIRRFPGDGRAGLAAFEIGRLKMDRMGDLSGAVRWLQQAIRLAPGAGFREDAMSRLVQAYDRMGAMAACKQALQSYQASYPHGVHAAVLAHKCGNP
jgi:transmembrane sensor